MAKLRLQYWLKRRGLSKRRFAKAIGMKYENVFRLFHDEYDPKLSMLERWARALEVRIRDLIKEE